MSLSNVVNKKWIRDETEEEVELFNHCKEMDMVCYAVTKVVLDADGKWNGSTANQNHSLSNRSYIMGLVNIQVLDQIIDYLKKVVKSFYKLNPKLARLKRDNALMTSKHDHMFDKMCIARFIMLEAIYGLIMTILNLCLHREDSRKMIECSLSLVCIYNDLVGLSYKTFAAKFNVCSNTYPNVINETKSITMTKVVQMLSKSRVEINCHRLINCMINIYKPEDNLDNSNSSTAESLEIYHTLTKHITPPASSVSKDMTVESRREAFVEYKKVRMKQAQSLVNGDGNKKIKDALNAQNSDFEIPYTSLINNEYLLENMFNNDENVNSILQSEEIFIEILLDTASHMSPKLLGANGVRKLKSGRVQVSKKAAHKVTEYYQNVLWGEVGNSLEHIVLWWSALPLATRSPNTSQNLREWLFTTFNSNNTPELVLAALRILADALGCHVLSTLWDRRFGTTLRVNLKPISMKEKHPDLSLYIAECTSSGANFALMMQELVALNNQCEVTWEYTLGAPIEDLPVSEQIPILHRLDHSIHTYRLWSLAETRRLANMWSMDDLFRVAHNDMKAFMEQLIHIRFADHTAAIESGHIGVHENVCAKMREKLVSEVKANIQKLKDATEEITQVISSVCCTWSLAHLSLIFPCSAEWRGVTRPACPQRSRYVRHLLDRMLLPVVKATEDITTLNMILRLMCESWLHHIYVTKVKFSKDAAQQLLADFNEVRNWLNECKQLGDAARKQMLKSEVLRRCEGVGRLLLHAPGDLISMQDSTIQTVPQQKKDETTTVEQLMPAEMYVPNQKQWLTLRAKKYKGPLAFTLCCVMLC